MTDKRIYVERRPEGDYAVRRPNSDRASDVRPTQHEAIDRARELNPGVAPHVERVRHSHHQMQRSAIYLYPRSSISQERGHGGPREKAYLLRRGKSEQLSSLRSTMEKGNERWFENARSTGSGAGWICACWAENHYGRIQAKSARWVRCADAECARQSSERRHKRQASGKSGRV